MVDCDLVFRRRLLERFARLKVVEDIVLDPTSPMGLFISIKPRV